MITKIRMNDLQSSAVGNTAMSLPIKDVRRLKAIAPMPGMTWSAAKMKKQQIADLGIPEVPDFLD
jgi:hypothetical protein